MKVIWFQIKNFRSIEDSGICYINDDITILAGKNESGKSNILKALNSFSKNTFKNDDYRNVLNPEDPEVTICFKCPAKEIYQIATENFDLNEDYKFEYKSELNDAELIVNKKISTETKIEGSAIELFHCIRMGEIKYWLNELLKIFDKYNNQFDANDLQVENDYSTLESLVQDNLVPILESNDDASDDLKRVRSCLSSIKLFSKSDFQKLDDLLPNFIYFNSFDDILPAEITKEEVDTSPIVKRFFKVANIDPNDIFMEESAQRRKQLVNKTSSALSGDFGAFYKQNYTELKIDIDGDKIQFYIYDQDPDVPYLVKQRSQGFQWFLSFYLTLKSESVNENSLILIDEPGLYLHAKAQMDMLTLLETLSLKNNIIFSTHSPYLIDSNRLDRIRLVQKRTEGNTTYIESKFHKVADKETLTPIISSIGIDINNSNFIGENNVVCEGISDYYYLLAMHKLLYPKKPMNFSLIPAVGVDQIPNVISILFGWGLKCFAIVDRDAQGKGIAKRLSSLGFSEDNGLTFVSNQDKYAIEDLISKVDFNIYILNEDIPVPDKLNSKLAQGPGKVLLARRFFDRVVTDSTNVKLDKVTIDNFRKLFERITLMIKDFEEAR